MKRPDYRNYRRESGAAMAWLALFAILVVGAMQPRFRTTAAVVVAQETVRASR